MKRFKVTILSKIDGVIITYWYHRAQAVEFLKKYSDIDEDFMSGIVEGRLGRCYEVVYYKSR